MLNQVVKALNDDHVSLALCVLMVVALTFFADKLAPLKDFMTNWYGKLTALLVVLFLAHHNVPLAMMTALVVVSQS